MNHTVSSHTSSETATAAEASPWVSVAKSTSALPRLVTSSRYSLLQLSHRARYTAYTASVARPTRSSISVRSILRAKPPMTST